MLCWMNWLWRNCRSPANVIGLDLGYSAVRECRNIRRLWIWIVQCHALVNQLDFCGDVELCMSFQKSKGGTLSRDGEVPLPIMLKMTCSYEGCF